MRASLDWIRQWITLPEATTAEQVADAFVHLGFEVEEIHTVEPTIGELVVGKVLTVTELTEFKKPIRFCTVDVGVGHGPGGSDEPRGIICGAANFVVGDRVVVALPGTTLPGGFTIGSRQTYGRISDGMICSVRELGTGTEHEGILVLDEDAEIGSDAREIIGADDTVIELSITADRGYAMSIRGLARELAAYFDVPFTDQAAGPARPVSAGGYPVRIDDPSGCGRFVTVTVHGIDPTAPAPFWMRRRLLAAGIRSISLAVDITNYVMLEYGHPLHAFDAGKLHGDLVVRRAMDGETLRTLDGVDRRLETRDLVVADDTGAISMAGVMGGETTEISVRNHRCGDRGGLLGPTGHLPDGTSAQAAQRGVQTLRARRRPAGLTGRRRTRGGPAGRIRRRDPRRRPDRRRPAAGARAGDPTDR